MTAGEGGLVFLFAITAVASLIGAARAEDTAFAFHAYLGAAASVAAVFAILNHYFDRPAAVPPQEIGGKTGPLTLPRLEVGNASDIPQDALAMAGQLALASRHQLAAAVARAGNAGEPLNAVEEP